MHADGRVASREELLPSPLGMPEDSECDPATLTGVTAALDALSCPTFSPFDLSTGAAQLLQVQKLACLAHPAATWPDPRSSCAQKLTASCQFTSMLSMQALVKDSLPMPAVAAAMPRQEPAPEQAQPGSPSRQDYTDGKVAEAKHLGGQRSAQDRDSTRAPEQQRPGLSLPPALTRRTRRPMQQDGSAHGPLNLKRIKHADQAD